MMKTYIWSECLGASWHPTSVVVQATSLADARAAVKTTIEDDEDVDPLVQEELSEIVSEQEPAVVLTDGDVWRQ